MNKKYLAEMVGTMFLVLMGCGSAVIAGDSIGYVGISLAFGFAVLAMVYSVGAISGCHINPAITLAMVISRKMNKKDACFYMLFQVVGAVIGAFILYLMVSFSYFDEPSITLGANSYESISEAFLAEFVFTALFIFVVLAATDKRANAKFAGVAIGLTLVIIHLVSIPITGTSVNPARSIGPAIFEGLEALSQLWLFIVAPFLGGAAGALLWEIVALPEETEKV